MFLNSYPHTALNLKMQETLQTTSLQITHHILFGFKNPDIHFKECVLNVSFPWVTSQVLYSTLQCKMARSTIMWVWARKIQWSLRPKSSDIETSWFTFALFYFFYLLPWHLHTNLCSWQHIFHSCSSKRKLQLTWPETQSIHDPAS